MKRGVESVIHPRDLAVSSSKITIYALDNYGFINLTVIDNFIATLKILRIDEEFAPLIVDLVHANLIYGIAAKIGILPGLLLEGDNALFEYLLNRVSFSIERADHEKVCQALLDSWRRVSGHPLAEKHHALAGTGKFEQREKYDLPLFVNYPVFVDSVFNSLLHLWVGKNKVQYLDMFSRIAELLHSGLNARPLRFNEFTNISLLTKSLQRCQLDAKLEQQPKIKEYQDYVERYLQFIQEECHTHIAGWGGYELESLSQKFPHLISKALENLLDGHFPLSDDHELNDLLGDIFQRLHNPDGQESEFSRWAFRENEGDEPPLVKFSKEGKLLLMQQALRICVFKYASENNIKLYTYHFPPPKALKCLSFEPEAQLEGVLNKAIKSPLELFALYQTTCSNILKEAILTIITPKQRVMPELIVSRRPLGLNGFMAAQLSSLHRHEPEIAVGVHNEGRVQEDEVSADGEEHPAEEDEHPADGMPRHPGLLLGRMPLPLAIGSSAALAGFLQPRLLGPIAPSLHFLYSPLSSSGDYSLIYKAIQNRWTPVLKVEDPTGEELCEAFGNLSLEKKTTSFWKWW